MRSAFFAALFAGLAVFIVPMTASARTPEPAYESVKRDGKFELRQYAPMIIASVDVEGEEGRATNAGFRPLADYIFGNNRARGKIEMTAPVTAEPSQTIAMTAPVTSEPANADRWRVSFVMPAGWTMETLPEPVNPDIRLSEVPARLMAAVRFSGTGSEKVMRRQRAELEAWLAAEGYVAEADAINAFYDPPWTPAPLRRNEVMIPVRKK